MGFIMYVEVKYLKITKGQRDSKQNHSVEHHKLGRTCSEGALRMLPFLSHCHFPQKVLCYYF